MCHCVSAAFTSPASVPRAAVGQRVPWDRLGPGDCALSATISQVTQERNWDVEKQTRPVTWLDVHPASSPSQGTVLGQRQRAAAPVGSNSSSPAKSQGKPFSREASGKIALDCRCTGSLLSAWISPFKGEG